MQSVGVFFGGKSPEHDISIITGQLVISGLKGLGINVIPVYVDKAGVFFTGEALGDLNVFTKHKADSFKGLSRLYLDLENSHGKIVFHRKGVLAKDIVIDTAFPAFHGTNGEDGTMQGFFEIMDVPYVGCPVAASAIAMDKVLTKMLYGAVGIPTVPFLTLTYAEWQKSNPETIKLIHKKLPRTVIVKPARLGSSIAMSKATSDPELKNALDLAFHFEEKVIVEEAVVNLMDVTCCVIGTDKPIPSLLQESSYTEGFFSYEDKYLKGGGAQLGKANQAIVIPARLDRKTTSAIREMAVRVFQLFECSGIARVDFLYDTKKKKYYANEVNALPGTIYHHLWQKSGIELPELLTKLLQYAQDRRQARARITYSFESSVLSQMNSTKLKLKG